MKHGKRLTRSQKELLSRHRLNPDNWLCVKNTPEQLVLVHVHTGAQRIIERVKDV